MMLWMDAHYEELEKDATPATSVLQQQIGEHKVCVCVCVCVSVWGGATAYDSVTLA